MTRVVVVGGGIAGSMAAVAAARAGAEAVILAERPGASALLSGALGLGVELDRLPAEHPLAALGLDRVALAAEADAGVRQLAALLERGGAPVAGDWRRPGLYADIHGRPRRAAPGELSALREGRRPVVVVGFEHVSDYDAQSTAEALTELCGVSARPEVMTADGLPPGASIADLAGRPAPAVKAPSTTLVAYPPGLDMVPDNGFELLATVPSPFGLAVLRALERLERVERRRARVERLVTSGGRVVGVVTEAGEEPAGAVVIATGRFIGGGLEMHRRPVERLAGAATWSGRAPAEQDRTLAHRLYIGAEAAFTLGVRTDARLRPLTASSAPAFTNLHAAGAVLGGYEAEAAALVAAITGRLAGIWAAA